MTYFLIKHSESNLLFKNGSSLYVLTLTTNSASVSKIRYDLTVLTKSWNILSLYNKPNWNSIYKFFSPKQKIHHIRESFLSEESIFARRLEYNEKFLAGFVTICYRIFKTYGVNLKKNIQFYLALKEFRITVTSNTSCNSAPYSGSIYPKPAKPIRTKLAPKPKNIPCLAILIVF